MLQIDSELKSIPDYDNKHEETIFKINNKNDNNEETTYYYLQSFADCNKSENDSEEINEISIMPFEYSKIEQNISQKYTYNKSEIISQKEDNKKEVKHFFDFKSISNIHKFEESYLFYDNGYLINDKYNKKIIEPKHYENQEIKNKIKINNIKEKKKNKIFFISKNRNIFKVVNPNKYYIFNCGNKDKCTRKFINETLKKKKFIILENIEDSIKIIIKQNRKYDADNIRKKIKARFLKYLKNVINERLMGAGSEYCFTFLPQNFICNIRKNINRGVLNLSLEKIFSENFCDNEKESSPSSEKYKHNVIVLDYLKDNQIISEKSDFNNFKDMKFYEIFYEYLRSSEFEKEINRIKKKENIEYVKLYIQLAANLINFFLEE